ncbi:hypothetical protein, partial [Microvirga yunnanensis]|uniref:hypothetical protein n=1 Tax=Microvirga yunnanensis TaxID=2953740 RepID=UPI0021C6BC41
RLRLDAALYEPAPWRRPGTAGRPRTKGARMPTLSEVLKRTSTLRSVRKVSPILARAAAFCCLEATD